MKQKFILILAIILPVLLLAFLISALPTAHAAAIITVDTLIDDDDGECVIDCTLREAVDVAVNGDTIIIPAGTHALTLGDITIAQNLTLSGVPAALIDGGGTDRVFQVINSSNVTFTNFTIQNGDMTSGLGGGIFIVNGNVTFNDMLITQNAGGDGGGIYADLGSITLNNTQILNNTAADDGAGLYSDDASVIINNGAISYNNASEGGGIFTARGNITFTNALISYNTATMGGGGVLADDGNLILNNSQIISNTAGAGGGGIYSDDGGITINDSTLSYNTANEGGGLFTDQGPVDFNSGEINHNRAIVPSGRAGGGVHIFNAIFNMNGGQIAYNDTAPSNQDFSGGGILARFGLINLNAGEISHNHTHRGGGLLSDRATIILTGTNILSNTARYGGGIYLRNPEATFTQTGGLIAHNVSTDTIEFGGGGIYIFNGQAFIQGGQIRNNHAYYEGGGIYTAQGLLIINGGDIRDNLADNAGGGLHVGDNNGQLFITDSTLNGNQPDAITLGLNAGTALVTGNQISNSPIGFHLVSGSMTAYANTLSSYTLGISGTVTSVDNVRHNWWGTGASLTDIGDQDTFDYRLGAPIVAWSDTGTLTDTGNGGTAAISATFGTGLGVIVSHGRGTHPFGTDVFDATCSDYYDFFVVGGSNDSMWQVSAPVDPTTDCEMNTAGGTAATNQLFHFEIDNNGIIQTNCIFCYILFDSITRSGSSGNYLLTATNVTPTQLGGTPVVAAYGPAIRATFLPIIVRP